MPEAQIVVRPCFEQDLEQVALIYGHHVTVGAGSLEYDPPSVNEMRERWSRIVGKGWPYLVACPQDDITRIAGYAYAAPYRERAGYARCFEDSVYVAPGWERKGVGFSALAHTLMELESLDVRQVVAVIGGSDNAASIALHAKCGFSHVGTLWGVGWKFGRWHDVILMQRELLPKGSP